MSGSQYVALSGLRARLDDLDRLAADIANLGTTGYKSERASRAAVERPSFDNALQTAIDTTMGGTRIDMTEGAFARTERPLDLAIDGPGMFVVSGPGGSESYTRNGHFSLNVDRQLVTDDGSLVVGERGPITVPDGDLRVDQDGRVWAGDVEAGRLKIVEFGDPAGLGRGPAGRFSAQGQTADDASTSVIRAGSLEQSNVTVADRIAQLTTVSRGFEAMQKALSTVMDMDTQAIAQLGRRR